MKFVATILFLIITFLTVAPIVSLIPANTECSNNCSSADNNENTCDEQNGRDCCPNGICNPFEVCTCCVTLPTENNKIKIAVYQTALLNKQTAENSALTDFTADCWHPPKTV